VVEVNVPKKEGTRQSGTRLPLIETRGFPHP
jgi:hypothetical protein